MNTSIASSQMITRGCAREQPNTALQTGKGKLSCPLQTQKRRQLAFAASFLIPAICLAAFVWTATTYILYSIGQPAGATLADVAAGQLTGLLLLILAVVSGALLGRWFYKREIGAGAAAA